MFPKEPNISRTLKSVIDLETMQSISWEDLLQADEKSYNLIRRAATQSKQSGTARYACGQCGFPVYAPRDTKRRPYWKHFSGAPIDCPWWTGDPNSPDRVSASQFDGLQEGPLHFKIKNLLAEILKRDVNATEIAVEQFVLADDGRRKPDVSAIYEGTKTAFEIQLATTQLPVILAKEAFYARHGIRLIWVTWDFQHQPFSNIKQSFRDIYFSHDENLFSLDTEAIEKSLAVQKLILRAHAFRDERWHSKLASLETLSWNPSGLPFAYPATEPWHLQFESRWISCRKRRAYNFRDEEELLTELSDRLSSELSPDDWRHERFPSLLDFLYSLQAGRPLMTNQDNLAAMANSFLNTNGCLKFAKVFEFSVRKFDQRSLLKRPSVFKKLKAAREVPQLEKNTPVSKALRLLLPHLSAKNK